MKIKSSTESCKSITLAGEVGWIGKPQISGQNLSIRGRGKQGPKVKDILPTEHIFEYLQSAPKNNGIVHTIH